MFFKTWHWHLLVCYYHISHGSSELVMSFTRQEFDVVSCFFQEWQEEVYPPYANGPGYVISSDIAQYIVSEFDNQTLRVRLSTLSLVTEHRNGVLCSERDKWMYHFCDAALQDGRREYGNVG